jgi:2-oxoglutarate ferredoxin oxidoreductase subunit alpha
MTTEVERLLPEAATSRDTRREERVNDCAIKLANVNGTGSASANSLLMQSMFRMGIPVSGKNLFPSNIQGLPTWYEIRVNKAGHTARALRYDLMVAMNAQTYADDIEEVAEGGYVMYDSSWPLDPALLRPGVTFLGVPLAAMCNEHFRSPRERILMKNIAYTGALVAVLGIELPVVSDLLTRKYAGKEKLRESNQLALRLGYDFATQHFDCPLPVHVERMDATRGKILIDGNTATALGCLYAGATVAAWYPITPATSVMDAFKRLCERYRVDRETGERSYVILQAEDELAAIGMVIGAGWNGARAFTSTAGPGISLMNELLGLAYYAEIPAVVVDVQRTGPSTGMPTRTQQADILECAYASHGDTKHILLFPGNPAECFEFAARAFDLAERFQTPVIMLSDLDIGMNDWVIPELTWDDTFRPDRGRVLAG